MSTDQSRLQATYREIENQSKFLSEKIMRQQVGGGAKARTMLCLCYSLDYGSSIKHRYSVVAFLVQSTLQGKIEREITEKKLTENQVNKLCCKHVTV